MIDKKFMMKTLKEIHSIPTAPYNERLILDYIKKFAKIYKIKHSSDELGNLVLHLDTGGKKPVGIMAHTDHPGFEMKGIENGKLVSRWHGGAPPSFFNGQSATFFPKRGNSSTYKINEIIIDRNPKSKRRRVTEVHFNSLKTLAEGTPGMWFKPKLTMKGDFLHAAGHDDLSGCTLILCALRECIVKKMKVNIYAVFSRAEETGFTGAIGFFAGLSKHKLIPNKVPMISVETSKHLPGARQGKGIVIRTGDRLMTYNAKFLHYMDTVAQDVTKNNKDFCYQKRLMDGGACEGTVFTVWDFPSAGLALPLDNYHNVNRKDKTISPEIIHKKDLETGIELFSEIAGRMNEMDKAWKDIRNRLLTMSKDGRKRLKNGHW